MNNIENHWLQYSKEDWEDQQATEQEYVDEYGDAVDGEE